MESISEFFTDDLVFDTISSYLAISDLLRLCQINRYLNLKIQEKCKFIIKNHNLSLIPSKTAIHQMRFYFDRCLTLYKKREEDDQVKHEKVGKEKQLAKQQKYNSLNTNVERAISYSISLALEHPFKFKTITYFQVGVQYTVYLTIEKEAYIFKTCTILNLNLKDKKPELNYLKRSNVAQIKCKSEYITYLTQKKEVYRIFGQKNSQNLLEKEEKLQWCDNIEIEHIQASFNYTIFKPKSNNISYEEFLKYVFNYEIDLQKLRAGDKQRENQKIIEDHEHQDCKTTLVLVNNISFKYNLIEFDKLEKIIQIVVGNKQAYFLNEKYQCFVCYFDQEIPQNGGTQNNNKIIKAKLYNHFIDKPIIKLVSGYNFFLALQRKIHDVSKWTVEEVCKWVRQIGFGQFAKIFNAEKVDGKKLLTIDKNYMYSSLGITKPNMQQKFLMLLQEVMDNKNKEDTLYGWGKNQNGQLGSRNANFIKEPQKIKTPNCLKQSEYIDSIFCGWFETFIRTQKGRVYRTVNYEKRKRNKQNTKQEEQFETKQNQKGKHLNQGKKINVDYEEAYDSQNETQMQKNSNKKNKEANTKKRRKYTEDKLHRYTGNHKKFQEQEKWIQCQIGKAFFVQGYKDILFFIQCPSQKHFEPTKEKKLRTAKMVLNKIIWSLCAEQQGKYKVGYMDKDMGLIETTILQLKTFDYNQNRIKYIKKANQIVWDRQSKIDLFG